MADTPRWWQRLGGRAFRIVLGVLLVLVVINLVRSVQHNYAISRQIRSLTDQIADEHAQTAEVQAANAYYQTATYKELTARRLLGLTQPGETMVLEPLNTDTTPTSTPQTVRAAAVSAARKAWDALPPYRQWYLLFFGSQTLLEQTFGS